MDHLQIDRNFVGAACERRVQTLKLHLHDPSAPLKGFRREENIKKTRREGEEMEEEKQRRNEEKGNKQLL